MELALAPERAEEFAADAADAPSAAAVVAVPSGAAGGRDLAALSRGVAQGDEASLAALYEAWFGRSLALARTLTRRTPLAGEAAALDIVQDAFIRIIRSMRPMTTPGDVERWMARVIKTTALDHLRRESRRIARERRNGAGAHPAEAPDAAAEIGEQIRWLRDRLGELSPEERALLGLRFGHERTLEEAGAAAGLSGDAAHGRVRRTLDRLRASARSMFHERA